MLQLTKNNYYTPEADWEYMSCSQYQGFRECEAKALAKLQGRWKSEDSEALIVGNYFHSAMENPEEHKKFCDNHFDDIYKYSVLKTGEVKIKGKYAAYEQADKMLEVCNNDQLIKSFIALQGEHEVIMTGELFGIPWRIRLDKYIPQKHIIIDWKTTANIRELKWNSKTGEKETFIEAYGYMMRAAVYSEIEKQFTGRHDLAKFIIVAISKQDYPDKEVLLLNHQQRYDYELSQIDKHIYRIVDIKRGYTPPKRCGVCDYCRATKKLKKVVPYYTLNPQFAEEKEEEFEYVSMYSENMENTQKA